MKVREGIPLHGKPIKPTRLNSTKKRGRPLNILKGKMPIFIAEYAQNLGGGNSAIKVDSLVKSHLRVTRWSRNMRVLWVLNDGYPVGLFSHWAVFHPDISRMISSL